MKRFLFLILTALLLAGPTLSLAAPHVTSDAQSPTITRRVSTLADLKLITGKTAIQAVQLMGRVTEGDGGQGIFRWLPGDQSANSAVTSDTLEGTHVKPTTPGDGSTGVWSRNIEDAVYAAWFGALFDGSFDVSAAINAAGSWANANGYDRVILPSGTGMIDALTVLLHDRVVLVGQGHNTTILKLEDGANKTLIKSKDFDTLTGSNIFPVSSGNQYGFGLEGVSLVGNKANNASGYGMQIYGLRPQIHDVYIRDFADTGLYSEGPAIGGQVDFRDAPEAQFDRIWVRNCDGDGVEYQGPHDGHIGFLATFLNGGVGFISGSTANTSGSLEIDDLHSYANNQGVVINKRIYAGTIITESNKREGLIIDSSIPSLIANLRAFTNNTDNVAGIKAVDLKTDDNRIGNALIDANHVGYGLYIEGARNVIANGLVVGNSETDWGVFVAGTGDNTEGILQIRGVSKVGARGIQLDTGVAAAGLSINVSDCDTGLYYDAPDGRNVLKGFIFTNAGQTDYAGQNWGVQDIFEIQTQGVDNKRTVWSGVTSAFLVDAVGTFNLTMPHDFLNVGSLNTANTNVLISILEDVNAVYDYGVVPIVDNIDASDVFLKLRVNTASATPATTVKLRVVISRY